MQDEPEHLHQLDERDERPTVPSLYPPDYPDDGSHDSRERDFAGARTWPVNGMRTPAGHTASRGLLPLALGASLGVNVALLLGLVSVLTLARAGAFAPPRSSAAASAALGTPTSAALSTPTPTSPLSSGWLQVAPTAVQLGCDGDQQTQTVVLTNTGPHRVQWQAVFSIPTDQAGIEVSPNQGGLRAGARVEIQVRTTTPSTSQQGVIRFEPDSSDAGMAPSLSYTTTGCQ